MDYTKYIKLDTINIENRQLIPIAGVFSYSIKEAYFFMYYTAVAFVIHEKDSTYYINISLSEEDFERLKDNSLIDDL